MSLRLISLASILLLATGCGFLWDPGECGPPPTVDLSKLDGKTFVSDNHCHEDYKRRPSGPIELRIDMAEKRLYISFDASDGWGNQRRIEEVWRFE